MVTINIDPIIFSIGHFALRWYSLIVMTAIVAGVWLAAREAERKGFEKEAIYDGVLWIVPAGLAGARLFHVLDHWPHRFAAQPISALYIWEGGLAIWGGVVGGLVATALFARSRGWRISRLLDAVAPGLVLGQAIGRFACITLAPGACAPAQVQVSPGTRWENPRPAPSALPTSIPAQRCRSWESTTRRPRSTRSS